MTTASPLQPLGRVNLFREVLAALEGHVDDLQDGDRLPSDRELAVQLDVSRPLIRQALKVLEGLGRVEMRQGVGTFVRDGSDRAAYRQLIQGMSPSGELVANLLQARKVIEEAVLRAAFAARSEETVLALMETLEEAAAEHPGSEEVRMDLRFEARLGRICGNPILQRLQGLVHGAWLEVHRGQEPDSVPPAQAHQEHLAIAAAIRDGDLQLALDLLEAHLDEVGDIRDRSRRHR